MFDNEILWLENILTSGDAVLRKLMDSEAIFKLIMHRLLSRSSTVDQFYIIKLRELNLSALNPLLRNNAIFVFLNT